MCIPVIHTRMDSTYTRVRRQGRAHLHTMCTSSARDFPSPSALEFSLKDTPTGAVGRGGLRRKLGGKGAPGFSVQAQNRARRRNRLGHTARSTVPAAVSPQLWSKGSGRGPPSHPSRAQQGRPWRPSPGPGAGSFLLCRGRGVRGSPLSTAWNTDPYRNGQKPPFLLADSQFPGFGEEGFRIPGDSQPPQLSSGTPAPRRCRGAAGPSRVTQRPPATRQGPSSTASLRPPSPGPYATKLTGSREVRCILMGVSPQALPGPRGLPALASLPPLGG